MSRCKFPEDSHPRLSYIRFRFYRFQILDLRFPISIYVFVTFINRVSIIHLSICQCSFPDFWFGISNLCFLRLCLDPSSVFRLFRVDDFSNQYLVCISIVGFRICFVSNFQFRYVGRCLISFLIFGITLVFCRHCPKPWSKVKTHRPKNEKGCLKQGGFKATFLSKKVALNKQALKQPFYRKRLP